MLVNAWILHNTKTKEQILKANNTIYATEWKAGEKSNTNKRSSVNGLAAIGNMSARIILESSSADLMIQNVVHHDMYIQQERRP